MFRRRLTVKVLILVPIIWILVTFFFGISERSPGQSQSEKDKIQKLVDENKHLIAEAARRHQEEKKRKLEHEELKDDHDHPEEEQLKAQEQQKEKAGPIQVHAPIERNPNAPGELGKPVHIDKNKLSPEERVKYDEGWKNNAFNQYVSDMISIHRSLADIRDPACKSVKWYDPLPSTSVIIIFHNEAWSVLLRTIHSVIDRSDPNILKEVIVVDDFSDFRKYLNLKFFFKNYLSLFL